MLVYKEVYLFTTNAFVCDILVLDIEIRERIIHKTTLLQCHSVAGSNKTFKPFRQTIF